MRRVSWQLSTQNTASGSSRCKYQVLHTYLRPWMLISDILFLGRGRRLRLPPKYHLRVGRLRSLLKAFLSDLRIRKNKLLSFRNKKSKQSMTRLMTARNFIYYVRHHAVVTFLCQQPISDRFWCNCKNKIGNLTLKWMLILWNGVSKVLLRFWLNKIRSIRYWKRHFSNLGFRNKIETFPDLYASWTREKLP